MNRSILKIVAVAALLMQLTLLFNGIGAAKSTNLDDDAGIDVVGATDHNVSGFAQLAFNL